VAATATMGLSLNKHEVSNDQARHQDQYSQFQGTSLSKQYASDYTGGSLGGPSTASSVTSTFCPQGSSCGCCTFKQFPPLKAPETFNLSQVLEQVKTESHPADCSFHRGCTVHS
jgi:hypothetical protein